MKKSVERTSINIYLMFGLLFILFLFPFIVMLIGSLKPSLAFHLVPMDISPFKNLTLTNFSSLFAKLNVVRAFKNSFLILVIVVFSEVFIGITTGYLFAIKQFPLKRILFGLVIVTMMLPRQLLLIPNFMVAKELILINKLIGVTLTTINASYGIFISRQYVFSIPKDFYYSAQIDGCDDFQLYFKIIFPLMKPVMVAIAVFSMFAVWNDYLWQNIMLTSIENQTVPLMLAYLASTSTAGIPATGLQLAGSIVGVLPVLILFIIFQRWFIEGVGSGGLKE